MDVPTADRMKALYDRAAKILVKHGCPPAQFRGGVSSLAEFMGKRKMRADVVTHDNHKIAISSATATANLANVGSA